MAYNSFHFNFSYVQPMPTFGCFTMPSLMPQTSLFGCNQLYNSPFFSPFNAFSNYSYFSPFMGFNTPFIPTQFYNPFRNFGIFSSVSPVSPKQVEGQTEELNEIDLTAIEANSSQKFQLNSLQNKVTFGVTSNIVGSSSQVLTPPVVESKTKAKKKPVANTSYNSYSSSEYATMSKKEAEAAAKKDSNLEKLTGGAGWRVSEASFVNDIPYAKKGMNEFLTKLAREIGENLVVTSALGTATSPHAKDGGHYDATNPKLDFGGGLSVSRANSLKQKLDRTGYFSRVDLEVHGSTAHLDVRVKESALNGLQATA